MERGDLYGRLTDAAGEALDKFSAARTEVTSGEQIEFQSLAAKNYAQAALALTQAAMTVSKANGGRF